MMGVQRDSTGLTFSNIMDGSADYRIGKPFDARRDADWQHGWLSAAESARLQAQASSDNTLQLAEITRVLTASYAALKAMNGLPRLTPGNRRLASSALHDTNILLARL